MLDPALLPLIEDTAEDVAARYMAEHPAPAGEKGDPGPAGADSTVAGPKGDRGDAGPKGDTGPTGLTGKQGPKGKDGQGIEEVEAVSLPPGAAPEAIWSRKRGLLVLGIPKGQQGEPGPAGGVAWRGGGGGGSGAAGPAGATGAQGPAGPTGADAPSTLDVHLYGWDGSAYVPVLGDSIGRLVVTS